MKPLMAPFAITNLAFAGPAWADCAGFDRLFMACEFDNGKVVELCLDEDRVAYRFGPPGQVPELALTLAFGDGAELVPWSGVGREIAEMVRLTNGDVTYEVYGGFDRMTAADDSIISHYGGIRVEDSAGNELAHLHCVPGSVYFAY